MTYRRKGRNMIKKNGEGWKAREPQVVQGLDRSLTVRLYFLLACICKIKKYIRWVDNLMRENELWNTFLFSFLKVRCSPPDSLPTGMETWNRYFCFHLSIFFEFLIEISVSVKNVLLFKFWILYLSYIFFNDCSSFYLKQNT